MIAASLYYHVMRPQEKAVATLKNTGRFFITRPPQREGNRLGTCYGRAMSLSNTNTNTRRDETRRNETRQETREAAAATTTAAAAARPR